MSAYTVQAGFAVHRHGRGQQQRLPYRELTGQVD